MKLQRTLGKKKIHGDTFNLNNTIKIFHEMTSFMRALKEKRNSVSKNGMKPAKTQAFL